MLIENTLQLKHEKRGILSENYSIVVCWSYSALATPQVYLLFSTIKTPPYIHEGAWGSVVVKALCY